MDSPRERDQTIERLLRQSLETPPRGGVTDACLDAETLAAWTAGSLPDAALEAVHLHVADCPRCQELAGTLARLGSTVPQAAPVAAPRRWLAWFVPLTAAAAAVAIWFAVPGNLGKPITNGELNRVDRVPPPAAEPAAALPSRDREAPESKAERQDAAAQPNQPVAPAPAAADRRLSEAPAAVAPPAAEPREERARSGAPPSQPAPGGAAAATASKEAVTSELARDRVDAARVQAPPAAAAAPAAPPAERFSAAQAPARGAGAPEIVSPDPAVRWRILGSAVQHSSNGGSTWEAVSTGVPAELTAGAAPATTVCWLVGRNGVVLLTVDGRTWRRVPFPEATDLSAVRAVDAGGRVASVSTTDGRMFVTTDAGTSWVSR